VVSVLIVLLGFGEINFWPVLIIVFRELAVEGLRSLQMMKRVVVGASFLGKVKTVLQMMAVLFLILKLPFSNLILWLAVALTILSGLDYLMDLVQ
jgi:CDP-diacylglycerol--glycerol-3-phosphate 3-phosphatidyltransferase